VAQKYLSRIDSTATEKFVSRGKSVSPFLPDSQPVVEAGGEKTCEDFGFIRIHFFPLEERVAFTLLEGCVEKGRIP